MEEGEKLLLKNQVLDMISEVDDLEFIVLVYKFVKRLKENWGI